MPSVATLWIPFTIIAALGQVARHAMQRSLPRPLGTWRWEGLCGFEAGIAGPRGCGGICAVGRRLSRRSDRRARRLLRDGGVLYAGVRPVRADAGVDDLSAGPRARRADEDFRTVAALDARGLHGRVRLAILVSGICADGGCER